MAGDIRKLISQHMAREGSQGIEAWEAHCMLQEKVKKFIFTVDCFRARGLCRVRELFFLLL